MLADGGAILNVSSDLARFCTPGKATYATMKGVEVLTRDLGKELGPRGIRVSTIAPSTRITPLARRRDSAAAPPLDCGTSTRRVDVLQVHP